MNYLLIAGHLGADVETRFTPSGQKVSTLRIATNNRRGNKDETIWWRVTLWGDRFDKLLPYLKKGSSLIVTGDLSKPEIYNDKEGNPQVVLNITAEAIRFSPFGRGERAEGAAGGQQPQGEAGDDAGFSFAAQSNYGKGYTPGAAVQPGMGQSGSVPGDNVPF
jgi:single-strand DNA-binding protein